MGYLHGSNVRFDTDYSMETGRPIVKSYPNDLVASFEELKNCGPVPQTPTVKLVNQVSSSFSVTITDSVQKTVETDLTLKTKADGGILGGETDLRFKISLTDTHSKQTVNGTSTTRAQEFGQPVTVPANTDMIAELVSYKEVIQILFTTPLFIDADLPANDKGFQKLSDAFPLEKRTLYVRGVLTVEDASNSQFNYLTKPLHGCTAGNIGIQTSPYVPHNGERLKRVRTD